MTEAIVISIPEKTGQEETRETLVAAARHSAHVQT